MASSLLALLDDIATILDDVAVLSKVAVKKTSGVLGDDLALNAQQVSGVAAERELPVVWAVAKGSMVNKLILVPAALAISALAPWAVVPLLMVGGAFLCFEGAEKILHKLLHSKQEDAAEHAEHLKGLLDPNADLVAIEKEKIKGAVRTDFILSAEIIVISLGSVAGATFAKQVGVLSVIAIVMTVGVYGLVAAIVKLDDFGLYLTRAKGDGVAARARRAKGAMILRTAPYLMKSLSVLGTAAMFLVGGSILIHGIPPLHHGIEHALAGLKAAGGMQAFLALLGSMLIEGLIGLASGAAIVGLVAGVKKLLPKKAPTGA
ncbi:DUF808 domain-containing protein [Ahniella affigens]|uniref:DUF808 domain-containing protein n=1 Tax=Ahniella affigens TaxID=2021234 RepID=A0A2P1PQE6_9GAMM|nr:DUF808 domain-containing protein [Ahniella affigens]AVP97052.1 DUF808 domain-containing protein [Ahniella affigens]